MERLTPANAAAWVARADVIVDAADSLALTYILSDECLRRRQAVRQRLGVGTLRLRRRLLRRRAELPGGVSRDAAPGRLLRAVRRARHRCRRHGNAAGASDPRDSPEAHADGARASWSASTSARCASAGSRSPRRASRQDRHCASSRRRRCAQADLVIDLRSLTEAPVSPFAGALRVGVEEVERAGLPDNLRRAWSSAAAPAFAHGAPRRRCSATGHADLALIALGD